MEPSKLRPRDIAMKPFHHAAPSLRRWSTLAGLSLALSGCAYHDIHPTISEQQQAAQSEKPKGNAHVPGPIIQHGEMRFQEIQPGIWQHTSYLDLPGFGPIASNGLLVVDGETSVLVDTAWTNDQTRDLVGWVNATLKKPIRAAVVTHGHSDKMGGMDALHEAQIPTYATAMTNEMAAKNALSPAKNLLIIGENGWLTTGQANPFGPISLYYPGGGHTPDNITAGIKRAGIAFGGCLIKSADARSLGNLNDADIDHYAQAVANFGAAFPDAQSIIMSHSPPGDRRAIARSLKLAQELN